MKSKNFLAKLKTWFNKNDMENKKWEDFELIPDTPISADEKDKLHFGYQEIAETLAKIAEKSPTPFTIGLFGKWGTGKSTILNQLENYLDPQSLLVIFDVWKYESDALRRSFILDTALQLKEKGLISDSDIERTKEKLYLDISKPREGFRLSWRGLIIGLFIFVAVLLFQIALAGRFSISLLLSSFLIGVMGSLPELLKSTVTVDKITVGQDRIESPEEFSEEFQKILSKIGRRKLIIGVDNLDRVDRDKAVEMLGTVKTFLTSEKNKDNVIFIIACDDRAIKEYLKSVYHINENQNDEFDTDEFLRKFFNTILGVPRFLNLELDEYTKALLKETKVTVFKNLDLEQIINYTFRDNPREIKQFINNLTTHYLFAIRRVEAGDLDKSFVNKNISFIAKLLIIRQRFPNVYNAIEQKTLREACTWQELIDSKDQLANELPSERDKLLFNEFLDGTSWITPSSEDIAVFITLRRSKEEKELAGWDQFVNSAINKRTDTARKIIQRFRK